MPDTSPRRLTPPVRGVSDKTSSVDQPAEFAPVDSARNVIAYTGSDQRQRMGTRFGTSKMFPQQFGNGNPVQAFCVVERASGTTGLVAGDLTDIDGTNRVAASLKGHCFVIDPIGSMFVAIEDSRAIGGLAGFVKWHPTERKVCFGTYFDPDGAGVLPVRTGLSYFDCDTTSQVWQSTAGDGFTGLVAGNGMVIGTRYTFVAAGRWVWVYKTADGTFCKKYDCNGWANEVMWVGLTSDGLYVIAVFTGGGPATADLPNAGSPTLLPDLSFVRSGAMKFQILEDDADPLRQVEYGDGYDPDHTWYERGASALPHGYLRFSEQLARSPRGCWPYSAAIDSNDNLVVGFTNKGFGWTNAHLADNSSTAYTNVAKFDSAGALVWEADARSRRVTYTGVVPGIGAVSYLNDIPQLDADDDFKHDSGDGTFPYSVTPKPSANAVAVDSIGDVYVAGQRSEATGRNVYKLRGDTGNLVWEFDVGSVVEQHAIAIDPTTDDLWVAVMRNNVWTGATGQALILKLSNSTGSVLFSYDINPYPATYGAWGIDVNTRGEVAFCTNYVS